MLRLIGDFSLLLFLLTVGIAFGQPVPKALLDTMPRHYEGPRLLVRLIGDLTAKFGWTISFEEPAWVASQGTGLMFPSQRHLPPELRNTAMNLPDGKIDLTEVFSANYASPQPLIQACLNEYFKQGIQVGYSVRERNGMLQIMPYPESPAVKITGPPPLEWDIEIPVAERFPLEHLKELCKAVERASGIMCHCWDELYFDVSYTATFRKKTKWGCAKMKARAALEDYLSHSMTTRTWFMLCEPREGGDRRCYLSLVTVRRPPTPPGKGGISPKN